MGEGMGCGDGRGGGRHAAHFDGRLASVFERDAGGTQPRPASRAQVSETQLELGDRSRFSGERITHGTFERARCGRREDDAAGIDDEVH